MAEELKTSHDDQVVDQQDRGLFDFMKKDEKSSKAHEQEAAISQSADHFKEKVKIEDDQKEKEKAEEEEKKKPSLLEKLHHRSNSSSSSSSSDEEGEGDEKKKKKKKEKKEGKDEKKDHDHKGDLDTTVPVEKVEEHSEEQSKKGLLDKIKEKLPGTGNKTHDQQHPAPPADQHPHEPSPTGSDKEKEKKGFLDKIKEKLPGYHSNTQDQTGPHDQTH